MEDQTVPIDDQTDQFYDDVYNQYSSNHPSALSGLSTTALSSTNNISPRVSDRFVNESIIAIASEDGIRPIGRNTIREEKNQNNFFNSKKTTDKTKRENSTQVTEIQI